MKQKFKGIKLQSRIVSIVVSLIFTSILSFVCLNYKFDRHRKDFVGGVRFKHTPVIVFKLPRTGSSWFNQELNRYCWLNRSLWLDFLDFWGSGACVSLFDQNISSSTFWINREYQFFSILVASVCIICSEGIFCNQHKLGQYQSQSTLCQLLDKSQPSNLFSHIFYFIFSQSFDSVHIKGNNSRWRPREVHCPRNWGTLHKSFNVTNRYWIAAMIFLIMLT